MTRFPSTELNSSQQVGTTRTTPSGTASTRTQKFCPASPPTASPLPSYSFNCLAQNAAILGITPEAFLSTHSVSPFYQPFSTPDISPTTIPCLPSNLRPSVAQLSYPHQAWIDCVPDPDIRSRIIFAICHKPPLLDGFNLWDDLLAHGNSPTCPENQTDGQRNWKLSNQFRNWWQMLLKMDLQDLQTMCTTSNPPLLLMHLSEQSTRH